ncbi:unnamed protein product [Hermetia illucens]|uniref:Bardet-Biedl syndrome 7 n=1 Tax=Hermetia illucens TaxID=343691 RepID=A0A7R8UHR4_HERIL|nr:unnamed protein product [Hermetia illucens]
MELELTRIDYGTVGTTSRNCLKLLPNAYKKQQKVVIADVDGNVQLFTIKKTEAQIIFQVYAGKKVSSIQLGGAVGSNFDKIFVATENIVKGYTKKGKMFLSFDTNLTEAIKCMFVLGADLIVCGNHVYNHYRDCKDVGTYLCGDTIVDAVALSPNNTNRIITILACSGRVLRVLEHCRVRQTIELESVPTALHVRKNILGDKIMCGFADGKIIAYNFAGFIGDVKDSVVITSEYGTSAITCIDTYDLTGEGNENLLIGRRDGSVQVFSLPAEDEVDLEPREIYRESFTESISAIQGGCVYSNGATEIVIATYAGSVFGLTTQIVSVNLSDRELFKELLVKNASKKQPDVDNQVEGTSINLVKPRERYTLTTQIISTSTNTMSAVLDVNDSVLLDAQKATYSLTIEMPVPILEILYQSEINIQFLDLENDNAELTENQVDSTGPFSWAEVHNWMEQMLPEVPERLSGGADSMELYYKNVLIGTILECKYGKGWASFRSDNLSTISILKDFLTKEATKKRIKLEITSNISEASINHVLRLIEPAIQKHIKVKEEHKFLLALLEVDIRSEDDWNCLLPKYQSILERRSEIENDFIKTPGILQRYFGVITDFYIDRFKFKGMFVKDKIPELMKLLEDYKRMEPIIEFFQSYTADEVNSTTV